MDFLALIFDLDGVIIDSEALHNDAVAAAVRAYGAEIPWEMFDEYMGSPDAVLLAHANERYLGGRQDVDEMLALKQQIFLETIDRMQLVPGAVAFIAQSRPHFRRFALATSSLPFNQEVAFERFELNRYFDVVVTAADVPHTKPHPAPYLRAVELLGLPAAQCLVIEDSLNGVRSAKAAGCAVIGLTTSYSAAALAEAGADDVCMSFEGVAAMLGLTLAAS
ncbi:MAG: HAD family phosphatase [Anaerolineales bacterium]|nr:HAD family phosphatase [Anaerolineales bacterium]